MLASSDRWEAVSDGAFNPRVQVWSALWTCCSKENRLPTEFEKAGARRRGSSTGVEAGSRGPRSGGLDGPPVSLNAIAKGFIVERACDAAMKPNQGIEGVILNVGGDMRACGSLSAQVGLVPPWSDSETSAPMRFVTLRDRCLPRVDDLSGGS